MVHTTGMSRQDHADSHARSSNRGVRSNGCARRTAVRLVSMLRLADSRRVAARLRTLELAVRTGWARRRCRARRASLAAGGALCERPADGIRHEAIRVRVLRSSGHGSRLRDHLCLRARHGSAVRGHRDEHASSKRHEHGKAPALEHRLAIPDVLAPLFVHLDALVLHEGASSTHLTAHARTRGGGYLSRASTRRGGYVLR